MTDTSALVQNDTSENYSFEEFKSNVCHQLKSMGDIDFMLSLLDNHNIRNYFNKGLYRESLYLLAMLDYLCRIHDLPRCNEYDDLRAYRFEKPIFPLSIILISNYTNDSDLRAEAIKDAIPEFLQFNIVEGDVRDVC
ncbi:MAG: hypothetical protein IJ168_02055 [Eubacterium sp.]|nr:hypothetical protein [Eubacterium sp.]